MLTFDVKDRALHELVSPDAPAQRVAGGFGFTEGPVWRGDHLLFSDIPNSRTVKWRLLSEGPEVTTFRTPTGNANGLTLDKQGRLLACEHSGRQVSRIDADGTATAVADRYEGKRLNSPNDVIVRSDGTIYFTDPPYGLRENPEAKELAFNGVYRIAPDGTLVLLADDFDRPNGLALSPDEKTLYVDDSARRHIRAFDVQADGSITNDRIFLDMSSPDEGSPDGMKIDVEGNIFCTGPGGIWVANPAGDLLGRIILPEQPANLAWGDEDWRMLYVTARTGLYRIRCRTQGVRVP
jgi:gluconolactonase